MSSDGILRLDLDLEDAVMPNGTHYTNVDGTENHKEATASTLLSTVSEAAEEQSEPSAKQEPQTEPEISPQKKVIKPPMPPTKEAKLSSSQPDDEPDKNDGPEKKVCIIIQCRHICRYTCLVVRITLPDVFRS